MLLPAEITPLMLTLGLMLAGIAIVAGAPGLGGRILLATVASLGLQTALATMDPAARMAVVAVGLPVLVLMWAQAGVKGLFGAEAAGMVIGTWLVRLFDLLFRLPGAILRRLLR